MVEVYVCFSSASYHLPFLYSFDGVVEFPDEAAELPDETAELPDETAALPDETLELLFDSLESLTGNIVFALAAAVANKLSIS